MIQEDKELLLKDLSTRLPYGVRGKVKADAVVPHEYDIDGFPLETTFDVDVELQRIDASNDEIFVSTFDNNEDLGDYIEECQSDSPYTIEEFTPYLRPMSSMTEEENEEYIKRNLYGFHWDFVDWCNSKHLDYRGLIERGLALEAPKDMYNIQEKHKI